MTPPSSAVAADRPSWGRRLVGIEGLRGIAALSVLVAHVQVHTAADVKLGRVGAILRLAPHGLTLFFALSGFLLYRPFAASIASRKPKPPTRLFFENRALRIFPAYVVILLLASYVLRTTYVASVPRTTGVEGSAGTLGAITDPVTLIANLPLLQTFFPATLKTGIGPAWSLTTELTFYLVLPVLAALGAAVARRTSAAIGVWMAPAMLFVVGVAGKVVGQLTAHPTSSADAFYLDYGSNWHAVFERSLLAHADLFAYGAAAAVVFVLVENGTVSVTRVARGRAVAWVGVVGAALLVGIPNLPGPLANGRVQDMVVGAASAALILVAALPARSAAVGVLGRVLELRALRGAGLISYSVYLWHIPVIWWMRDRGALGGHTPAGFAQSVAVVAVTTLALAAVTYKLVEKPALRLKRRTDAPQPDVIVLPDAAVVLPV